MATEPAIRPASRNESDVIARVIGEAFLGAAERFALTRDNCPGHPSFCTRESVEERFDEGVRFHAIEVDGDIVGCVAMTPPRDGTCELIRLVVLPAYRRSGYGAALVRHVLAEASAQALGEVRIGIVAQDSGLRAWYERLGFVVTGSSRPHHLPFDVTLLAARL